LTLNTGVAGWGEAAADAEIPEKRTTLSFSAQHLMRGLCQTRSQSSEFDLLKDAGEWNASVTVDNTVKLQQANR